MNKIIVAWLLIITLFIVFAHIIPEARSYYGWHYVSVWSRADCSFDGGGCYPCDPKSEWNWIGMEFQNWSKCYPDKQL